MEESLKNVQLALGLTLQDSADPSQSDAAPVLGADAHPRFPQYTKQEVEKALEVFKMLRQWRDEAREKQEIDW